jgi:hypothetical protein
MSGNAECAPYLNYNVGRVKKVVSIVAKVHQHGYYVRVRRVHKITPDLPCLDTLVLSRDILWPNEDLHAVDM